MPLKLNSSGGGSVTLDTPSTASTYTLTVPAITGTAVVTGSSGTVSQGMLASGVAGNGPAFSATLSANQTVTAATWTKGAFATEEFDTNSNYDTTLYRFTPTVAGYYLVSGGCTGGGSVNTTWILSGIYKNGVAAKTGSGLNGVSTAYSSASSNITALISMNGTTDYLEFYFYAAGSGTTTLNQSGGTFFQASLVRAA